MNSRKQIISFNIFILFLFVEIININGQSHSTLLTALDAKNCGIDYQNTIKETGFYNHIFWENVYHGAGVAIGDINNDGLADIFFAGNQIEDELYINKGEFNFQNSSELLDKPDKHYWSSGVTMVDINADGWLDIYVSKSGPSLVSEERKNLLYINNNGTSFTEQAESYGLADEGYSMQTVFFDMDNDGDLDAYVMNQPPSTQQEKMLDRIEPGPCDAFTDNLYLNNNNHFENITEKAGVANCAYGLGVVASDINHDGLVDLYVSNDYFVSDHFYLNKGDGTFNDESKSTFKHQSLYSMGVDVADFNNDGMVDVFTADMSAADHYRNKANMPSMNRQRFHQIVESGNNHQYMFNALQLNNGQGHFSEIAQMAGVANTDWSWSALFLDINNSGNRDLLITNGIKRDVRFVDGLNKLRESLKDGSINLSEILTHTPSQKLKNYSFENLGNLEFEKKGKEWGFNLESFSGSMAYGDLDNDGDLDLIVNNVDDAPFIFKNNSQQNYLKIKLVGPDKNLNALGAKVKIRVDNDHQFAELNPTRGYLSSSEPILHFGLGDINEIDQVEIIWDADQTTILKNIKVNQTLTAHYNESINEHSIVQQEEKLFLPYSLPLIEKWKHQESIYNPFKNEVLLPHKLSQLGPALAVADINNDGLDDLFVGGAKGQSSKLYMQKSTGIFHPMDNITWSVDSDYEDVEALFLDVNNDGLKDLYVASGSNEFDANSKYLQDRLYLNQGNSFVHDVQALPPMLSSTGVVIKSDYDKDGDMDLFVGGLMAQQNYPHASRSYVLQNDNGKFKDVTETVAPSLSTIGMVRDALWSDYDVDGDEDLIIVGEWMNIMVIENKNGHFSQLEATGLANTSGMWHSILAHDFDKDGDEDYIVGNLGLNNKFKNNDDKGFHVFANDFDDNGFNDIILSKETDGELWPVRGRECSSEQVPIIAKQFPSFHDFANASLPEIYSEEKLNSSLHYEIEEMGSIYVENKGDGHFEWNRLPIQAQLSTVTDILTEDYDLDGNTDIIIVGNKYETEVETARYDASIGLFLRGNGKGEFIAKTASESGFLINGNTRNLANIKVKNQHVVIAPVNDGKIESLVLKNKLMLNKISQ